VVAGRFHTSVGTMGFSEQVRCFLTRLVKELITVCVGKPETDIGPFLRMASS